MKSGERLIEILSVALLSLATVASAWSAYQASVWSGARSLRLGEANAARVEAAKLSNNAYQLATIDVGMFVQFIAAVSEGNQHLAEFLRQRFRPEMKVAVDAWLATRPLEATDAPSTPFAMAEYVLEPQKEAQNLEGLAAQKSAAAQEAESRSDRYVFLTVVFASVLFFAGIGTKFQSQTIKIIVLALGVAVFLGAALVLVTFPIG